jgi:DNA-binding Xre family transcriptional regulator
MNNRKFHPGIRISQRCQVWKISNAKLAKLCDVSEEEMYKYITGKNHIPYKVMRQICVVLNCTIQDLCVHEYSEEYWSQLRQDKIMDNFTNK